jgi:hypothetical protein
MGNPIITNAVQAGLEYIAKHQQADGSFMGYVGPHEKPYLPTTEQPTIFFTSLVLTCLAKVPRSKITRHKAADFLLSERRHNGRWNYWTSSSLLAITHPYPDDIDDLACALLALESYDAAIIDGTALGHLAEALVATEVTPGGPYHTWLEAWDSVDIAVNANVGCILNKQKVELPGLNAYIHQSIERNELASEFYIGILPTIYFISRWYNAATAELTAMVIDVINDKSLSYNALSLAIAISSGCHLRISAELLYPLTKQLLGLRQSGHWPAEAFYKDFRKGEDNLAAGSNVLTTAFAVEALEAYRQYAVPLQRSKLQLNAKNNIRLKSKELAPNTLAETLPLLRNEYAAYRQKFLDHNNIDEITAIATITARSYGKKISSDILKSLNSASLSGWIAYSIYDDFLDGGGKPSLLGVANQAARDMYHAFESIVPDTAFMDLVNTTLSKVDEANIWETLNARAPFSPDKTDITRLPDYGDYAQLAYKSLGHMLTSCGVLVLAGIPVGSKQMILFQQYFFHFLIARQLNDDAHDWEEDISEGRISSVICLLLANKRAPITITPRDIPTLRKRFWQHTITDVDVLIRFHCEQAQRALNKCTFLETSDTFSNWLTKLTAASEKAILQSHQSQKFIEAFSGKTGTVS